jgi:hypothetical protein
MSAFLCGFHFQRGHGSCRSEACSRRRLGSRAVFCRCASINCGSELARDGGLRVDLFLDGVHIRFCGNGCLRFRPYGGLLGKAPSNQALLPLSFGASPRLGMPSLRSCSEGPPPSAIHRRGRLTQHLCRFAHCAEPPLSLSRGRTPQQHCEAA